jgi:hypothetical protein
LCFQIDVACAIKIGSVPVGYLWVNTLCWT